MSVLHPWLPLVAMSWGSLLLAGCGLDVVARHKAQCLHEARLIVRDPALWAEFQAGANRAFEDRRERFGPATERATIEAVPGFEQKYGANLADDRDFPEGRIARNDVFIVRGKQIVAQYVDFIGRFSGIDGSTNLYCLGQYPELYSKEGSARRQAGPQQPES